MTYDQTQALFEAMENLETYAKMQRTEVLSDTIDWDEVDRYRNYIKVARKDIFDLVGAPKA